MTRRNDGLPGYHPIGSRRAAEDDHQTAIQREVAAAKARAQAGTPSPVPDAPEPPRPAPGAVAAPAALKGAVKVEAFPDRSKYPFREIADDGGMWRLDLAAYGNAKAVSVRAAASKWAQEHGLKVRTVVDEQTVYVQFSKAEP